jgi:CheY-like chemotaxis protein
MDNLQAKSILNPWRFNRRDGESTTRATHHFLLVEDNENDALLLQRAFMTLSLRHPIHHVLNGEEAVRHLSGAGSHPRPDVVLLDLTLPHRDGFEVLSWIRGRPELKRLIVIILTNSNSRVDADRAFDLGANFYLTKPGRFEDLVSMINCLNQWLHLVAIPPTLDVSRSLGAAD